MEQPKDYFDEYKARYSQKDIDDTRVEYFLYGIAFSSVVGLILAAWVNA